MSRETDTVTALKDALGASANGVSWSDLEPGMTLPWVTLHRVTTPRRHAFGANNPVTRSKPRFQADVWAADQLAADAVMVLLRPAVCALPGAITLVAENGRRDEASGWWHAQLDWTVAHGGL